MCTYVNNISSVRAAKYLFDNKFGWGDNKTQVGVYNTYTKESNSLYESEFYAYLTMYNHIEDFVENGNLLIEKQTI